MEKLICLIAVIVCFSFISTLIVSQGGLPDDFEPPTSTTTTTSTKTTETEESESSTTTSSTTTTSNNGDYFKGPGDTPQTIKKVVVKQADPYEAIKKEREKQLEELETWLKEGLNAKEQFELRGISSKQLELLLQNPDTRKQLEAMKKRLQPLHGKEDEAKKKQALKRINNYIRAKIRRLKLMHQKVPIVVSRGIPITQPIARKLEFNLALAHPRHHFPRAPLPRYITEVQIITIGGSGSGEATTTTSSSTTTTNTTTTTTTDTSEAISGACKQCIQNCVQNSLPNVIKDRIHDVCPDCDEDCKNIPTSGINECNQCVEKCTQNLSQDEIDSTVQDTCPDCSDGCKTNSDEDEQDENENKAVVR